MPYEKLLNMSGQGGRRLAEWKTEPCIGINKCTISFNARFAATFNLRASMFIFLFADIESGLLGFRVATDGNTDGAYRVHATASGTKKASNSGTLEVTTKRASKVFPTAVQRVFRPQINADLKVIEIDTAKPL